MRTSLPAPSVSLADGAARVRSRRMAATAVRLGWIEVIKGVALVWIVWNHVAERLFGLPLAANPSADWPPLAARIAQLEPLGGHGWLGVPLNLARWIGWAGDQGVQLFLIVGAFGLTWGLLDRGAGARLDALDFWRRRARRIFPLWWAAHLGFVGPCLLLGRGLDPRDWEFWIDLLAVRVTPGQLYYFAPAWWFIGLLVQLYAVYPVLWSGLRRLGTPRFLCITVGSALAVRLAGLLWFHDYLDAWSRGAIFVTRLPEFALGMGLAAWMHAAPGAADAWLRRAATRWAALGCWLAGTALSLGLVGMAAAPVLLGAGAFGLLYAPAVRPRFPAAWSWVGRHSYALFLVHHPFIAFCVPEGLEAGAPRILGGLALAVALSVAAALALEWAVGPGLGRLRALGWRRLAGGLAQAGGALALVLVAAELTVRRTVPREVWGWGERPSLERHDRFGWRLQPSSRTRLRWLGYDYRVRANALGFPGPNRPEERAPRMLRVVVTGDAFSSAEGVDTDAAWPRQLESALRARSDEGRVVEVLNFAMTGYGPNQQAAVLEEFVPRFRPDVVVLQMFVNDFEDALTSDEVFHESIGFDRLDPGRWWSVVALPHLADLVKVRWLQPLYARLTATPPRRGYHLGNFPALERNRPELETGRRLAAERVRAMARTAEAVGARFVVVGVPAPGQVCAAGELPYWPAGVDLHDEARFDPERPQRWMAELAASAGAVYLDLRDTLDAPPCPYQPHNMHWTRDGHRRVAERVAAWLAPGPPEDGRTAAR